MTYQSERCSKEEFPATKVLCEVTINKVEVNRGKCKKLKSQLKTNDIDTKWCSIIVKMNLQKNKCIYIKVIVTRYILSGTDQEKKLKQEMNVECISSGFKAKTIGKN